MGVLTDFFVATDEQVAALDTDALPADSFDTYQAKGVDTIKVDLVYAALTERPFSEVVNCGALLRECSPDGPWIFKLPSDLAVRLAKTQSAQLSVMSEQLTEFEDFEGWLPEDVSQVLHELSSIARRVPNGSSLYHWVCV